MEPLDVIADDLTGACDVAAALLPWPGGIAVYPDGVVLALDDLPAALAVRNTQSRTLPPAAAAGRVRAALGALGAGAGILLKKIDTGLRGPLGAEIDAALDATGAPRAFVLPAIPEVGRTTVDGEQRIDGVPVHRTAFADDPQNPVRDAHVVGVIQATARRVAASIGLDAVRRPGGVRAALAACTAPIVVFDAETDGDLTAAACALLAEPGRPLLLVGSIGLARALRAAFPLGDAASEPSDAVPRSARGVLVVLGSAHPVAREQRAHAQRTAELGAVLEVTSDGAETTGRQAARLVRTGHAVALAAPDLVTPGHAGRVAGALSRAVAAALAEVRPAGLVLVGGETAFEVLAGLGHPPLVIESRPAPLAVHGRIAAGPHRGLAVVTKGGSSGEPELLAALVRRLTGGGA